MRGRPARKRRRNFGQQKAEAKRVADQMDASKRMQVTVVSESDLQEAAELETPHEPKS